MVPGSIKEQIRLYDEEISDEAIEKAVQMVGLHEYIVKLEHGYETMCSTNLFSQGQIQLLAIARAVVANPMILLLDEITANLDSDTERKVLEALQKASQNRTVVSISHRLYEKSGGRVIEV
jgi:ABC-type multidrug transport system fused ATPase/permease subunit